MVGLNRKLNSLSIVYIGEIKSKLIGIKQMSMTAMTKCKAIGKYWK